MNTRIDTSEKPKLTLTKKNGKVEPTMANIISILQADPEWTGVIAYDSFAGRVVALEETPMRDQDRPNSTTVGQWTEAHTARARAWLAGRYGCEPGKENTDGAVEIVAHSNSFHPVHQYLDSIEWDGIPRLDGMLVRYFGVAPGPYASCVGSKFMIQAVARVAEPGCQADTMLILEGAQGSGKSSAVRVMAGEWFADTALDFDSKDAAQCLLGKWIYEFGELASFNRSEVARIKAFVSSPSDNLRPSYGRRNVDWPRQCVFIGTTNDEKYLTDTTGNRRFWPVRCGKIDLKALARDRDQLWAEAAKRWARKERWWMNKEEERLAVEQQSKREAVDPWQASISTWIAKTGKDGLPHTRFTVGDVLNNALCLGAKDQTPAAAQRVGRLLSRLGYKPRTSKIGKVYGPNVYVLKSDV